MTGIRRPQPPAAPAPPQPGRIAGPVAARWQVRPANPQRPISPDWTGFYESGRRPDDDQYAGVLMQVNQAGKAVVGWAVPPPAPIRTAPLRCFDLPTLDRWSRREIMVLFIINREEVMNSDGSHPMLVLTMPLSTQAGPQDPWYPTADPTLIFDRIMQGQKIDTGFARLARRRRSDGEVDVLEVKFQDSAAGFERLERLSNVPRVSAQDGAWESAKGMKAPSFHAWVTTHARPLPTRYLEDKWLELAPDALWLNRPGPVPPLAKAIRDWSKTRGPVRPARRRTVLTILKGRFSDTAPKPAAAYAVQSKTALLTTLATHKVAAHDPDGIEVRHSYRDWLTKALAEERQTWMNNQRPPGDPYIDLIADLGIPFGDYLYTFTFTTGLVLPIPLPPSIRGKIPSLGKYLRGLPIGFNPFYADVKREKVEVKIGGDGLPVVDKDGKIVCTRREAPAYDTSKRTWSGLIGFYLDLGIGIPKPGVDLKQVEILSANGNLTKDSFDGASFEFNQLTTASIGSSIGRVQGPGSAAISVSKHADGVDYDLMTITETHAAAVGMKVNSSWDFFKQLFNPQGVYDPSLKGPSFSAAKGWFVSGGRQPPAQQAAKDVAAPAPQAEVTLHAEVETFFEVDSNRIPETLIRPFYLKPRLILEAVLAQERALLINPHAEREVIGWASPEGTEQHNLDLSQARAQALAQAYLDAFPPGTVAPIPAGQITGLGEEPSLRRPLDTHAPQLEDPESVLKMTSADPGWRPAYERWKAAHRNQIDQWPWWRKAQLIVDGQTIISVGGPQKD